MDEKLLAKRNKTFYGGISEGTPLVSVIPETSPTQTEKKSASKEFLKKIFPLSDVLLHIAGFLSKNDLGIFRQVGKNIYRRLRGSLIDLEGLKRRLIQNLILEAKKNAFGEEEKGMPGLNLELEEAALQVFDQNTEQNFNGFLLKLSDIQPFRQDIDSAQINGLIKSSIDKLKKEYQGAEKQNSALIKRGKRNPALAYWLLKDPKQRVRLPQKEKEEEAFTTGWNRIKAVGGIYIALNMCIHFILFAFAIFAASILSALIAPPLFDSIFLNTPFSIGHLIVAGVLPLLCLSFLACAWLNNPPKPGRDRAFLLRASSYGVILALVSSGLAFIFILLSNIYSVDVTTLVHWHAFTIGPVIFFYMMGCVLASILGKEESLCAKGIKNHLFFIPKMVGYGILGLVFFLPGIFITILREGEYSRQTRFEKGNPNKVTIAEVASLPSSRWMNEVELCGVDLKKNGSIEMKSAHSNPGHSFVNPGTSLSDMLSNSAPSSSPFSLLSTNPNTFITSPSFSSTLSTVQRDSSSSSASKSGGEEVISLSDFGGGLDPVEVSAVPVESPGV